VTDHHGYALLECIQEPYDVTDNVEDGVRVNRVRSVCLSVPTLVGRHGVEAGFCKGI
jgi:hypothetical protein